MSRRSLHNITVSMSDKPANLTDRAVGVKLRGLYGKTQDVSLETQENQRHRLQARKT